MPLDVEHWGSPMNAMSREQVSAGVQGPPGAVERVVLGLWHTFRGRWLARVVMPG